MPRRKGKRLRQWQHRVEQRYDFELNRQASERTQPSPNEAVGRLSGILAVKYQVSVCHVINKIVEEEGTVGEGLQMSLSGAPKVSHG